MTASEVNDIIKASSEINPDTMDFKDQMQYFMAVSEFAEKIKPLVIKYFRESSEKSTFLFKL